MQASRLISSRISLLAGVWRRMVPASRGLLVVNTGTSCVLYTLGDVCQQRIEGCERHDWVRTSRMAVLGFLLGPVNHGWYTMLDKFLPAARFGVVAKKVLLDQLFMAPFCSSVFYIGMSCLEGRNGQQTLDELKAKFWPTYVTDWKLWPTAQAINFFFVPAKLRVTYVNSVTFIWTVYLSYMKHKDFPSSVAVTEQSCQVDSRLEGVANTIDH